MNLVTADFVPPIGRLLQRRGLIAEEGLQRALALQRREPLLLGEILVDDGQVGAAHVHRALGDQHRAREAVSHALAAVPRLGDMLVERGLVARHHIEAALGIQRTTGERLGQVLLRQGRIALHDLVAVLVEQDRLRNAVLAALFGIALVVQPNASALSGELAKASAEAVQISLTIPQRVSVVTAAAQQDLFEVVGTVPVRGVAPIVAMTPFTGAAQVHVSGSGPGGALVATSSDGALIPYHVELHDASTGAMSAVDQPGNVTMAAMPAMIEISFDGLTPSDTGPLTAGGTLLVTVGPGN